HTEKEPRRLGPRVEQDGFTFVAPKGQELRIVTWGSPPDEGKLSLPDAGLDVQLPWPAVRVVATVAVHTHDPVTLVPYDANGTEVGHATSTARTGAMDRVVVEGESITRIRFGGGGNEALLIRLCVYSPWQRGARTDDKAQGAHARRSW